MYKTHCGYMYKVVVKTMVKMHIVYMLKKSLKKLI